MQAFLLHFQKIFLNIIKNNQWPRKKIKRVKVYQSGSLGKMGEIAFLFSLKGLLF
jgi:hypothetical protein